MRSVTCIRIYFGMFLHHFLSKQGFWLLTLSFPFGPKIKGVLMYVFLYFCHQYSNNQIWFVRNFAELKWNKVTGHISAHLSFYSRCIEYLFVSSEHIHLNLINCLLIVVCSADFLTTLYEHMHSCQLALSNKKLQPFYVLKHTC